MTDLSTTTNVDVKQEENTGDQFIIVTDPADNEPVEIPMSANGKTVPMSTLEHAFPGAYGLKYKNPATGAKRVVPFDESGKNFLAPPGGWTNKVFELIFRPVAMDDKGTVGKSAPAAGAKRTHNGEAVGIGGGGGGMGGGDEITTIYESGGGGEAYHHKPDEGVEVEEKKKKEFKVASALVPQSVLRRLDGLGRSSCDIIVMSLPFDLEDWALGEFFEQFGTVEFREIKRKPSGESRGFGFVRMQRYSEQVLALSQPHFIIGGRECQVRISSTEKGLEAYLQKNLTRTPRLFVGGLHDSITKERVRELFGEQLRRHDKQATVLDMYHPKPFRNFVFMTVSSMAAGRELVKQRDFILDNYHCEVTIAAPRGGEDAGAGQPSPLATPSPMRGRQPPPHQPWAQQPHMPAPPPHPQQMAPSPYGYGQPPDFPPMQESRWDWPPTPQNNPGGGGGGSRPPVTPYYDDYMGTPRGGTSWAGGPSPQYQMYPPRGTSTPPFDPREDVRMDGPAYPPGRGTRGMPMERGEVWGHSGGGGNVPPATAEAILAQLPNDAVGTALKMLQSIMAGQQQQQQHRQGPSENGGGNGGGGGGSGSGHQV